MSRVRASIAVLWLLACAACSGPAASPEVSRSDVQHAVRDYVDATNRANVTAMMGMISRGPGVSQIVNGAIARGWDAIRTADEAAVGKTSGARMTLGPMDVVPLEGTHAIVTAPITITTPGDRGLSEEAGAMTLVLERTSMGWKIVHEHYSSQPVDEGD